MKSLYFSLFFLVVLFVFAACSKELDYEFPYPGDKLVINGILSPDRPVSIKISKTAPVSSDLTTDLSINYATVGLYENGVLLENLTHTKNGVYNSASSYKPVAGKSYAIRVFAEGFPVAETTPEIIPAAVTVNNYNFSETIISKLNEDFPTRKLVLEFTDVADTEDYYSVLIEGYHQGYRLTMNAYYLNVPFDAEDPCGFLSGEGNKLQYNLTDICFNGNIRQARFGVETRGFTQDDYQADNPGGMKELDCDLVIVRIKKISKSYYNYLKTGNQSEGFFIALNEPYMLLSYFNVNATPLVLAYRIVK